MKYVLVILAAASGLMGFGLAMSAKNAIHETQALVAYLGAAVLLAGFAVVAAIDKLRVESLAKFAELRGHEAPTARDEAPTITPTEAPIVTPTPDTLMAQYSITRDGDKYALGTFRYDRLEDAVAYARKTHQ